MKKKYFLTFLLIGFTISFQSFLFVKYDFQTGKKLPAVKVKNIEGEYVDVSKINNGENPIIFIFWATWCGPCIRELNNVAELYEDWQQKTGVQIYAVSIDDSRATSKISAFVEGKRWPYNILLDSNQDLMRALGFSNPPFTALVNKDGEIVWTHNSYIEGDEYELEEKIKEISGQ
ncbi:MAG: redoxin domain-containing protein [Bacteroidetes bacterium]|nr:redoxin domain-containing protein [Bacteroidota bacterium]